MKPGHVVTDLETIRRLSKLREDKNWRFRTFLKNQDGAAVDELVGRILAEVLPHIDCRSCGNCCRSLQPVVKGPDIERLARLLGMSEDEFRARFTQVEPMHEGPLLGSPCPFLDGNSCSVYEARPDECRTYPFLDKPGFVLRLMSVIDNCAICPIVFNVFERLKSEMSRR